MSHTPGPWSCDYGVLSVFCDTGAEVAACVRGNHDDGSPLTCDEMECNLNLLAAAPELLKVCRELLAIVEGEYELDPSDEPVDAWRSAIQSAISALAKAEGRSE